MPTNRPPSFGDVITSKRFRYGHLNYDGKPPIQVGQDTAKHLVTSYLSDDQIVEIEKIVKGKLTERKLTLDFGVPDYTRGTAEFVVINNKMQGGGQGMGVMFGHADEYPDGWHIVAKRLDKDGNWDENGEEIAFYMTGCFIDMILPEEVTIVRHMAMHFV